MGAVHTPMTALSWRHGPHASMDGKKACQRGCTNRILTLAAQKKKKGPKALLLMTVTSHRCEALLPLLVCRT